MDVGRSRRSLVVVIVACVMVLIAIPAAFLVASTFLTRSPARRTPHCRNAVPTSPALAVGASRPFAIVQTPRPVIDVAHRFWMQPSDIPSYAVSGDQVRGDVVREGADTLRFTPTGGGPATVFHPTTLLRSDCG